MSSWLRRYYNGAALRGGFSVNGFTEEGENPIPQAEALGARYYTPIISAASKQQKAGLQLFADKYGVTQSQFQRYLGLVILRDAGAAKIAQIKRAMIDAMDKHKVADATALKGELDRFYPRYQGWLDSIPVHVKGDTPEDKAADLPYKIYRKAYNLIHKKPRAPAAARAWILSPDTEYGPSPYLRYLKVPMSKTRADRMSAKLKAYRTAHEQEIKDRWDDYQKLLAKYKGRPKGSMPVSWPSGLKRERPSDTVAASPAASEVINEVAEEMS